MPPPSPPRYLSTAETAKALGVTARALRLYERRGLVTPLRTSAGWRAYGPDALARLHQVLALKKLGLSLAGIGELLAGRLSALDSVLALQEAALAAQQADIARGLRLVRDARRRLAAGEDLSLDDLATLTRETIMSDQTPEWAKKMEPSINRHFTAEDRERMKAAAGDFDPVEVQAQWDAIIADATRLMGQDPTMPEVQAVARRWRDQVRKATAGDAAVNEKLWSVWKDAFNDPDARPLLPFSPELIAWIGQAIRLLPD